MLQRSMLRKGYAIAIFVMAAGALCVAQSDSPSLGDLARKSRSEKKPAATLTTVKLTEDNFVRQQPVESKSGASDSLADTKSSAGDQQSGRAASAAKPASGDAKSATAGDRTKEDLKKEELKKQLDSYKATRDAWDKSAKRYEDLMANETDEFRRQMYQDALNNDRGNIAFYQNKIDQAEATAGTNANDNAQNADQKTSPGGNKP